ncbi:MAG: hypothetical protein GY874_02835 [Desulfobacteraceae bacterium]|nr:hypothetical protein [Desulfobacteraceae bacterium]
MIVAPNNDRRRYERYYVKNRIFAVVRSKNHQLNEIEKMSQGEIALAVIKSKPLRMGEIIEISRGGLSFSYIVNEKALSSFSEMDILFADEDFYLSKVPFVPVKDSELEPNAPYDIISMKRLAVQFGGLSEKQKNQLRHVLKNFTTGPVSLNTELSSTQVWGSEKQYKRHFAYDPNY